MLNYPIFPDDNSIFFPCPSSVTKGMPVLIGTMPAVAVDNYNATLGGCQFVLVGVASLTVIAQSTQSPVSGLTLRPGDELFASGSLDATTNVTTALTIDKTRGNAPFGNYVGTATITAGVTTTNALVRLTNSVSRD